MIKYEPNWGCGNKHYKEYGDKHTRWDWWQIKHNSQNYQKWNTEGGKKIKKINRASNCCQKTWSSVI